MSQIVEFFREVFTDRTYGKTLEDYVVSHNPANIQEVEALERQWHVYNFRNRGKFLVG